MYPLSKIIIHRFLNTEKEKIKKLTNNGVVYRMGHLNYVFIDMLEAMKDRKTVKWSKFYSILLPVAYF